MYASANGSRPGTTNIPNRRDAKSPVAFGISRFACSGSAEWWWLRAPQFTGYSDSSSALQLAYDTGKLTYNYAGNAYFVAFGVYYDATAQVRGMITIGGHVQWRLKTHRNLVNILRLDTTLTEWVVGRWLLRRTVWLSASAFYLYSGSAVRWSTRSAWCNSMYSYTYYLNAWKGTSPSGAAHVTSAEIYDARTSVVAFGISYD